MRMNNNGMPNGLRLQGHYHWSNNTTDGFRKKIPLLQGLIKEVNNYG